MRPCRRNCQEHTLDLLLNWEIPEQTSQDQKPEQDYGSCSSCLANPGMSLAR